MRRLAYMMSVAGAVGITAFVAWLLKTHVSENCAWVDSVSGSTKSQVQRRFWPSSDPVVSESALAARYRKLGLQWRPDWRKVQGDVKDVFGHTVVRDHDQAPAIYTLRMTGLGEPGQTFSSVATDDEVRTFMTVMSSGTEQEQRSAVDEACEKALEHLRTR